MHHEAKMDWKEKKERKKIVKVKGELLILCPKRREISGGGYLRSPVNRPT